MLVYNDTGPDIASRVRKSARLKQFSRVASSVRKWNNSVASAF